MASANVALIIPFRDRGNDPLRQENLKAVERHWWLYPFLERVVVGDGRTGDAQFNRSAAYNAGMRPMTTADVFVFSESDMLIHYDQIDEAVKLALKAPGLVVPFDEYCYLRPGDSTYVRGGTRNPEECVPEWVMAKGRAVGAINVVSRETMKLVGQWDEKFQGSWYDDRAMKIAFETCAGPTRIVPGSAYHLYHQPGWSGDHLTDEDKAATRANKMRYRSYCLAKTPEKIRELTAGGGFQ